MQKLVSVLSLVALVLIGGCTSQQVGQQGSQGERGPIGPTGPQGPSGVSGFETVKNANVGKVTTSKVVFSNVKCPAGKIVMGGSCNINRNHNPEIYWADLDILGDWYDKTVNGIKVYDEWSCTAIAKKPFSNNEIELIATAVCANTQ